MPHTRLILPALMAAAFVHASANSAAAQREPAAPYPPSPVIASLIWAPPETIRSAAHDSDNWPITWADDEHLFTAYGDGTGFAPKVPRKLSLGLARVSGSPEDFQGENIRSQSAEALGDGASGRKASGMLMVDGVLYMLVRNADIAELGWSRDRGRSWQWADWRFTTSFGCPTFLNFGRNYAGARDEYVYIYSFDSDSAYEPADRMVLTRVPKRRLTERDAYTFFAGLDDAGQPRWSANVDDRGAVFEHPGNCYRSGISYCAPLGRYLWYQVLPASRDSRGPRFEGGLGVYDAPQPWGPWTTVYFSPHWDVGPGESGSFPAKWMSDDGRTLHLAFSGDDAFSVRRATLTLRNETSEPE
ncbi:MAG: hypothetical protein WDZ59_15270 [Pirellulales bacterium]